MSDFSQAFQEGIISGLLSGFDILWQTFRTHPALLFLFAFILAGNALLKKMSRHNCRH